MSDLFSKMGFNYWQVAFSPKILDLLEDKRNTFIFNEILWSKFLQQRTLITIIAESSQVSSRSRWLGQSWSMECWFETVGNPLWHVGIHCFFLVAIVWHLWMCLNLQSLKELEEENELLRKHLLILESGKVSQSIK